MVESSKEYFDAIGSGWDALQQSFFSNSVREKAYSIGGARAEMTAADIGAGTGFVTEGLLQRGLKVIAVDQSDEMLDALKAKFPTGHVECRVGDADALPIDTGSVDLVFANMYLHHVGTPPKAIAEMVRILRPGGKLVITDLDSHEHEFLRTEQYDRWLGFDRDDIRKWLTAAGLIEVEVECAGDNCCTNSDDGTDVAISIFVASGATRSGCVTD